MAGLQTIIDNCNGITINRRKVVGIQITRNEVPRTSLTPTLQPWRFTLDMPTRLRYYQARDLIEALDSLDRYQTENVSFDNNPCMSWIFRYQGAMSGANISGITVSSFTTNQLVLTGLPSIGASAVLFEPNDLIQISTYPFPFTSTTQVLRGAGSTVTVTTNRPNILTSSVTGAGITVGSACEFKVFCPNMPTYKLVPGGYTLSGTTLINNAYVEFTDVFELYEYVGDA